MKTKRWNDIIRLFWAYKDGADDNGGGAGGADESSGEAADHTPDVSGTVAPPDGSVGASLEMGGDTAKDDVTINWADVIPENLREKETFQNILKAENPGAELAKQLDNAQTLLGKKIAPPPDDATEEQLQEWYSKTRPEKAEDYEFPDLNLGEDQTSLAERINAYRTEDRLNKIRQIFHEEGLTKRQAKNIAEKYEALEIEDVKQIMAEGEEHQKQSDAYFDGLADKMFGGRADKMTEAGQKFIETYATEEERAFMRNMPDSKLPTEALMIISALATRMKEKYEGQDKIDHRDPNTTYTGLNEIDALTRQIHEIMEKPEYTDTLSPKQDGLKNQVRRLIDKRLALQKQQEKR